MNQLDLFVARPPRIRFLDLRSWENAALERIVRLERHGRHTVADDTFSAVTMMRLEVARQNGWSPVRREAGGARHIGGFRR
jgi:hypothetical protein